jgi:hypothetical protein
VVLLVVTGFPAATVGATGPSAASVTSGRGTGPTPAIDGVVTATNATVTPTGVNESDCRRITVTATVSTPSADSRPDVVRVEFADLSFDADLQTASATANGTAVPVEPRSVAARDVVAVAVNATGLGTADVNVSIATNVQGVAVGADAAAPIPVAVRDAATGRASTTATLTVRNTTAAPFGEQLFCQDVGDDTIVPSQTCPRDLDGDGELEDVTGDGAPG